jgi:PPM family protein phosphatase
MVRKEAIEQITEDHSLVAEMINDGSITAEQAETHPYRNVILRSIGAHDNVKVDLFFRRLSPDDVFILCSDGLTRHVNKDELADIIRAHPPAEAARQLVRLSNERGGYDNITVSITRITANQVQGDVTAGEQLPEAPNWDDLHPAQ